MSCESVISPILPVICAKRFARLACHAVAVFAALFVLGGPTPLMAQACKPALAIKETRFSEPRNLQRTWTAVLSVDASRCAMNSGPFEIKFIRAKESAPDLLFAGKFIWSRDRVEVSVDFWWDEAVLDQWIGDVAPCGCAQ